MRRYVACVIQLSNARTSAQSLRTSNDKQVFMLKSASLHPVKSAPMLKSTTLTATDLDGIFPNKTYSINTVATVVNRLRVLSF